MRLILSLSILFSPALSAADSEPVKKLKSIELEWEQIPKATSYDVKLTPVNGGSPIVFTTTENHIVQTIPAGPYNLQIRSFVKSLDFSSAWSDPVTVEVVAKELFPLNPEDKSTIENRGSKKQTVEFRWSPVEHIKAYNITVWSEDEKQKPWVFTTKATSKKLEVPPGAVYYWQVKFESSNDVTYIQEPQTFSFTLLGDKLLQPEIVDKVPTDESRTFSWRATPDAKRYHAKISFQYLDENTWTLVREADVTTNHWSAGKLKTGRYKIEVCAVAPRRSNSENAILEFLVKPTQTELSAALTLANKKRLPKEPFKTN